jgi:hypothetical protein
MRCGIFLGLKSLVILILLASAATATVAPSTQISSKAVEKDGLSVQVSLKKSEISADEQPQFTVRFTNTGKEPINLISVDEYSSWKMRFTNVDQTAEDPGPCLIRIAAQDDSRSITKKSLKPGEFADVPVDINKTRFATDFYYDGIVKHLVAPIKHLNPGIYKMTVEIGLSPNPPDGNGTKYWTGPVTTEAVELKVVESGERGPVTEASPQELSAYNVAIEPLVKTFGPDGATPLGLWTNGLTSPIPLPRDAKPEDVIAAAPAAPPTTQRSSKAVEKDGVLQRFSV